MKIVYLRDQQDVTGYRGTLIGTLFAERHRQIVQFDRLSRITDKKLHILLDRALMQPDQRLPSHKRVEGHLEYMRENVGRRIRTDRNSALVFSEAIEKMRGIAFRRVGQQSRDEIQQFLDTHPGRGRNKADRNQMSLAHGLFESVMQLVRRDFSLVKIGCHQRLIHFNGLIHDFGVSRFCRRKCCIAFGLKETVNHTGAVSSRQVNRKTL